MKKENILITGAAGFIGSALAKKLSENKNYQIVMVDNLSTGHYKNLPLSDNCIFIKADVNQFNDISTIMTSVRFDYVFHYAAVVGVARTLNNPVSVLTDIDGIKNILQLSKNTQVKRVFFSSSSEVYGEPVVFPQHEETTPLNSKLPYAIIKNLGEAFLKSYKQEFDLNYTIFRFFNTYGPQQSEDFVISKFIQAALTGQDITIYGDGKQTRTFCYIDDNIDACLATLHSEEHSNKVFNIGNDNETSVRKLAEIIIDITGSSSKIVHLPALKEGDMTRRLPDITNMRELLKRDFLSLEKGIIAILETRKTPAQKTK